MLKAEMLAAMPAMNDASSPAIDDAEHAVGQQVPDQVEQASCCSRSSGRRDALALATSDAETAAIMPGMMMMNGMNIFGNEPMIGERRAADIELEAIARCTSTKLVVQ